MSSVVQSNPAFRIVSLPRELQSANEVSWYISTILQLGEVKNIVIRENKATNGALFRCAIVELESWLNEQSAADFVQNRQLIVNSYYYNSQSEAVQFRFDNGKPMLHLKFVLVEQKDVQPASVLDTSNAWSSIYIPVIPSDLAFDATVQDVYDLQTEDGLRRFFEKNMSLGTVSRVDFVSKSVTDSTATVRSAHVHFESWSDCPAARHVREQIDCTGEFFVKGHYDGYNFVRFHNRRFMVLKVNRNPIPEANPEANVHQLSARIVDLETQLEQLKAKLIMSETMCDVLKEKLGDVSLSSALNDIGPMTVDELTVEV